MTEYIDGIECYDAALARENDDFEALCYPVYQKYIPDNFWYKSRSQIIAHRIGKFINENSDSIDFLEIGCGNGFVVQYLHKTFPKIKISGSDIYLEGLKYSQKNNSSEIKFFQYNLFKENLEKKYNLIGCFDVLEHIEDDKRAIKNIFNLLTENGKAIITVPSDMNLWSNNDIINKHKRRYSKKEIINKMEDAGFEVEYINHFVFFLYPILFLKSRFQIKINKISTLDEKEIATMLNLKIHPVLNTLMYILMKIELFIIKTGIWFPFGSSIICVLKKK